MPFLSAGLSLLAGCQSTAESADPPISANRPDAALLRLQNESSLTVEAGGETYEVRAIDYMGEEPLEAGRYTYRLDIVDGSLQMAFEQD